MSDFCRMVTPKAGMSTEGETLHSRFLSYLTGAQYVLFAVYILVDAQSSSEVP
jgi:hypothetical protein